MRPVDALGKAICDAIGIDEKIVRTISFVLDPSSDVPRLVLNIVILHDELSGIDWTPLKNADIDAHVQIYVKSNANAAELVKQIQEVADPVTVTIDAPGEKGIV